MMTTPSERNSSYLNCVMRLNSASYFGESNTEFPSFSIALDFWYLTRHLNWIDDCTVFISSGFALLPLSSSFIFHSSFSANLIGIQKLTHSSLYVYTMRSLYVLFSYVLIIIRFHLFFYFCFRYFMISNYTIKLIWWAIRNQNKKFHSAKFTLNWMARTFIKWFQWENNVFSLYIALSCVKILYTGLFQSKWTWFECSSKRISAKTKHLNFNCRRFHLKWETMIVEF